MDETKIEEIIPNHGQSCEESSLCKHCISKHLKHFFLKVLFPYSSQSDGWPDKSLSVLFYLFGIVLIFVTLFVTKELPRETNIASHFVQESHIDVLLIFYMLPAILWNFILFLLRNDANVLELDNESILNQRPLFYGIYLFGAAFCLTDFLELVLHLRCNTEERVRVVYLCVEIVFVLMQIFFLLSFMNARFYQGSSAGLAVLHMVGTNFSVWLHLVFRKSSKEIDMSSLVNHTHDTSFKSFPSHCENMEHALNKITDTLQPLDLQFLVVALIILVNINRNIIHQSPALLESSLSKSFCLNPRVITGFRHEICFRSSQSAEYLNTSSISLPNGESVSNLDGGLFTSLFLALLLLALRELLNVNSEKMWTELFLVYSIYHVVLIFAILCANWLIAWLLCRFYPFYVSAPFSSTEATLFVSLIGCYAYNTFQIIVALLHLNTMNSIWIIINGTLNLFQGSIQTFVICKIWGYSLDYCNNNKWHKSLSHAVKFVVICNTAMALHDICFDSPVLQMKEVKAFFGKRTWTVIASMINPLNILYWFHSAVCFLEIWLKYDL